jgi:hypothetical protein
MFAFNLFDMNCDGYICENDLFSLVYALRHSECLPLIHQDIAVLYQILHRRNQEILDHDPAIDHDTAEIIDLEGFLKRAAKRKALRPKFMTALVSCEKEIRPSVGFASHYKSGPPKPPVAVVDTLNKKQTEVAGSNVS